jgi:hypothetical protein
VWTFAVPRNAAVKALRFKGSIGERPFSVPPAREQCGYELQQGLF